jgi:hypothetical protein
MISWLTPLCSVDLLPYVRNQYAGVVGLWALVVNGEKV